MGRAEEEGAVARGVEVEEGARRLAFTTRTATALAAVAGPPRVEEEPAIPHMWTLTTLVHPVRRRLRAMSGSLPCWI